MKNKSNVYIAHKMSETRHREIDEILKSKGLNPIYPEDLNPNFEKDDADQEARNKWAQKIFDDNIKAIKSSSLIIAFTDDWDPGVMFEIGYAKAQGINIITCSFAGYGSNIMIQKAAWKHFGHLQDLKNFLSNW